MKILQFCIAYSIVTLVFFFGVDTAKISAQTYGKSEKANEILDEYKVNTAFQPGEELVYELKYGVVKGGELKINVYLEPVGYDWMFHVVARCYTTGVISKMARVNDIYESWFDICTGMPMKAIRNVTENNYKRYNEDLFFQDKNMVLSMKSGEHDVPHQCFDILSAFFYARRFIFDQEIKKNETSMELNTWFNEKLYRLKLRYKSTEKTKTQFGKFECLKYVPVLDQKSTFKKEDDMQAWFTNDGNFVPVKIRVNMPFADIHCQLIKYKNLKNPDGLLK
ncbi:MAG: DUF3108 domain-containing protein [Bacteroidales bacterium]|nr:DUF3108 domain-containing protein [Bacteroidales bacterium]